MTKMRTTTGIVDLEIIARTKMCPMYPIIDQSGRAHYVDGPKACTFYYVHEESGRIFKQARLEEGELIPAEISLYEGPLTQEEIEENAGRHKTDTLSRPDIETLILSERETTS